MLIQLIFTFHFLYHVIFCEIPVFKICNDPNHEELFVMDTVRSQLLHVLLHVLTVFLRHQFDWLMVFMDLFYLYDQHRLIRLHIDQLKVSSAQAIVALFVIGFYQLSIFVIMLWSFCSINWNWFLTGNVKFWQLASISSCLLSYEFQNTQDVISDCVFVVESHFDIMFWMLHLNGFS